MAINKFQTLHAYRRLVRRGLANAQPLTCTCGEVYGLGIGKDDQPILRCFYCNSTVVPGKSFYDQIGAVVKEHTL